jgi:tetratricopeptide (TPR) repeat protein
MAGLFRPDLAIATNRALLAANTGRADEAAERFTEALRLAPHRTELHALLGDALLAAGRPAEARRQFELFCTLYETDARDDTLLDRYLAAGLTLGQLLREAGDLPAAAARLQRTADVAATRHRFAPAAAALGRLADVQEARGDPAAATATRALAAKAEGYARAP